MRPVEDMLFDAARETDIKLIGIFRNSANAPTN